MDALSKILETIKLKGVVYKKIEFHAPWGLEMPQDRFSQFWRLMQGRCVLKIPGEPIIEMNKGDLVFIPHGAAHWIADEDGRQLISSVAYVKAAEKGINLFQSEGDLTVLVGGHFEYDTKFIHPFLRTLPTYIHLQFKDHEEQSWILYTANLLFDEISNNGQGSGIMISRLSEILFIHTIRCYMARPEGVNGFLLALNDRRIGKALKDMHDFPEKPWTLHNLSSNSGMSRTLFFERFKNLVGETPLTYLSNWRMMKAAEMLATNKESISEIALKVGYQTESSFNKAFKIKIGKTPAIYRKLSSN